MKKINVNWAPVTGKGLVQNKDERFQEILCFDPEPLLKHLVSERDNKLGYLKCPAFKDYVKNTFVIKSPIDLSFSVDKNINIISTHNYDQRFYNNFITDRLHENNTNPMLSLEFATTMMWTNTSIMIEQLPPFMSSSDNGEGSLSKLNVIPGTFDISKWMRPVTFSFELHDVKPDEKITIKRGDPLYYIRFNVPNNWHINLVRQDISDYLITVSDACTVSKAFVKGNTMQQNYDLAEPLIKRYKKRLFGSKCPFHGWWK